MYACMSFGGFAKRVGRFAFLPLGLAGGGGIYDAEGGGFGVEEGGFEGCCA
jgi:hypothetical protein